ncbi:MAG: S8 family serine peptidase [Prosthecobacter sp.]|nr:S8 family serine peptidase [Prosthecobacter sp.]
MPPLQVTPRKRRAWVILALFAACLWPVMANAATEYVEGEVIVTFKATANLDTATRALGRKSLTMSRRFGSLSARRGRHTGLVRQRTKTTAALIAELKDDPDVESVEPNYLRWINAVPSDTRFSDLWALRNTGQSVDGTTGTAGDDVKFIEAWNLARSTNQEIVVGVIDTGVDYSHPDLVANMWTNAAENGSNHADDDSDGYVDDVHGFDFLGNQSDPKDSGDHGTHVAGTIAATGNNAAGTIGVAHHAKIMALRVSSNGDSISTSAVIEALQYATMMKGRGVNVVALNASYGGGGYSSVERDAIQEAGDAGIIVCAAAGNESTNNDQVKVYPASYRLPNMIVVAATDQKDALASFSNYGATSVDIAAPGTNILSTEPPSLGLQVGGVTYESQAMTYSGTTTGLNGEIYDCGIGNPADFPAGVSGNIALIERGTLTFVEKTRNAMNAGAIAVIVYNNVSGSFLGTLQSASNWVPTRSISRADGLAIKAALPTTGSLVMVSDYQFLEGTSMATPHVTGAVAFAAMNFPSETVTQRVQRILSSVDVKTGLSTKVATHGRLNLLRTVDANDNDVADWLEKSSAAAPTITTATPLTGGAVSSAYSASFTATGGTAPYTWSLLSGTLPPGLTLSSQGLLAGTPTTPGASTFAVRVTDSVNATSGKMITLNIASTPLTVSGPPSLANGRVGLAYSATLTAIGGTPAYAWSVTSGVLPAGLTLSSAGALAGTPTMAGTFDFTARVTDGDLTTAEQSFTVIIDPLPLNITTATALPVGVLNLSYSKGLAVTGGTGPYTWSVSDGALPDGLSLSVDGVVSGEPAAVGFFNFTALVTDSAARTLEKSFSLIIEATPITITTTSPLIAGVKLLAYTKAFAATGGTGPYTWALQAGALPTGMKFASTGLLSGTPTQAGTFNFTVAITDSLGLVLTQDFAMTVTATYLKPVVNPITLGVTTIGVPYTYTVSATNYPKSFNITKLPTGLTYAAATGVISGRPTVSGTFQVQVKATNPGGTSDIVIAPLVVNPLPAGFVGSFTGVIARDPVANGNLGGRLNLTITTRGYYTARITTGITTKSIVGYLAATAPQLQAVVGAGTLALTFDGTAQLVTGTHGAAAVTGWRSTWSAAHPASTRMGYYTIGIDLADAADDGLVNIPQGSGYAAFTVAAAGTLTVSGKAADGTAFTSAGFIGPSGEIAIYSSLYGNRGSLAGKVDLTEDANLLFLGNTISGTLTWLKPTTTTRTYAAAFGPINLNVYGKYLAASSAKGIVAGLPETGSAALRFMDGGLQESATDPDVSAFTYTSAKTVVMATAGSAGNPGKDTLILNKYTGLIGGTFTLVEPAPVLTRRVTFQGMIVRPPSGDTKAVGYFLLPQIPITGQTISTSPILSGKVVIEQAAASE